MLLTCAAQGLGATVNKKAHPEFDPDAAEAETARAWIAYAKLSTGLADHPQRYISRQALDALFYDFATRTTEEDGGSLMKLRAKDICLP